MRILAVTGSSGGHIFPALEFLRALEERNRQAETLLVLPKRSIAKQILTATVRVKYLSLSPLSLKLEAKNLKACLAFVKGFFESLFILFEFRPDIVVGFGTQDSLPAVFLAWLFRIKIILHEQNVIPGRANRLLVKFADKIAISFPATKDYLRVGEEKIVLTGNPLRKELKPVKKSEALDFFGLKDGRLTVLVMGGSQGSRSINIAFLKAVEIFPDKSKLQAIHISGIKDYASLKKSYEGLGADVKLMDFLDQMQYAYSISDVVICRAGATTISELINFRLPAIIIPYPFAYRHQLANAEVLQRAGSAILIKDELLSGEGLSEMLEGLINEQDRLKFMRSSYDKFSLNLRASDLLGDTVFSLSKRIGAN